jgi:hypothetical protein
MKAPSPVGELGQGAHTRRVSGHPRARAQIGQRIGHFSRVVLYSIEKNRLTFHPDRPKLGFESTLSTARVLLAKIGQKIGQNLQSKPLTCFRMSIIRGRNFGHFELPLCP